MTPSTAFTEPASRPIRRRRKRSAQREVHCRSRTRQRRRSATCGSGFVGNARLLRSSGACSPGGISSSRRAASTHALRSGRAPSAGLRRRRPRIASGQRGWNRQPGGGSTRSGGAPGMECSPVVVERDRRAQQLPRVRVRGLGEHVARRALLDDPPGVHHRDPVAGLGDDAEVVRDQQDRGVEVALAGRRGCAGSAPRRARRARSSARRRRRTSGRSTSASAIMMRWRMPPENSCG